MSEERQETIKPTIDWGKIQATLPETVTELLEQVKKAYESAGPEDDPAHAVDLALAARLAAVRRQFDQLKGDKI